MEAPRLMSSWQVSRWPSCAATYSGVAPFCMNTNTASNNADRKVVIFCETELVWTFQHRRLILSSVLIWPLKIFKLFTCWSAVLLRWRWPVVICLSYTWQDTCSVNPLFISWMSLQFSQTGRFVCFELLFFYYYKTHLQHWLEINPFFLKTSHKWKCNAIRQGLRWRSVGRLVQRLSHSWKSIYWHEKTYA